MNQNTIIKDSNKKEEILLSDSIRKSDHEMQLIEDRFEQTLLWIWQEKEQDIAQYISQQQQKYSQIEIQIENLQNKRKILQKNKQEIEKESKSRAIDHEKQLK